MLPSTSYNRSLQPYLKVNTDCGHQPLWIVAASPQEESSPLASQFPCMQEAWNQAH